jgi:hypothetical protein
MNPYLKQVFFVDTIALVSASVMVFVNMPVAHAVALLLVAILTTSYALIGYYVVETYLDSDSETFMSKVFGGVFIRLAGLASLVFLILWLSNLPQITFIVGLFISYISKSVLEIIFIHRKSAKNTKQG